MLAALPLLATLECVVPAGPVLASARLADGRTVSVRDGALELGRRRVTFCDGMPDPHPVAVAPWRGGAAVAFRAGRVSHFDGARFLEVRGLPRARALASRGDTLWVGTADGLWTVDARGAHRDPHAVLGHHEITALYAASDGALHVGAGARGWWRRAGGTTRRVGGAWAGCFVEQRGRVQPGAPGPACQIAGPDDDPALPSGHITALEALEDRLYVGTFDRGLYRLDATGRAEAVAGIPRFVNALVVDGHTLWVGTAQGLFRVAGDQAQQVALGPGGEHVNGLERGDDGVLRVATSHGLAELTADGVRILDERAGLPSRLVYCVTRTGDGAVWAGTSAGAVRFAPDGGIQRFTQAGGALPHDWVTALLPDGDGVLAGTYDAGVVRLTADGHGRRLPGLEHAWVNPNGLHRLRDRLLVLTLGDGLLAWDRSSAVTRLHLPDDDVTALLPAGGGVWIGTRGGLVRTDM